MHRLRGDATRLSVLYGGRSDGFNYFSGLEAFGADVFFALLSLNQNKDFLQVRQPAALGMPVGMGNAHADHWLLITNKTSTTHNFNMIK
jgi:hypothetical protein